MVVYLGKATPASGKGAGGGSGVSITVDDALSTTSTNPVQNAVVTGVINGINEKIPSQASAQNQLADKSFVNSSIATNTANFIGTFSSLEDLIAYTGTLTNNDYAFVSTTDASGNTIYKRYKYNGSTWVFEYDLNNSSFTAAQFAALNSGATSTNIGQITTNASDISDLQAQAGNATLTTTAQTLSGAINELDATIPTVNNSTISFTQGGVSKGSFNLNQSTDTTIELDAGGGSDGLQNTATGENSLTIKGTPATNFNVVNIGVNSLVDDSSGVAIGTSSYASYCGIAIGNNARNALDTFIRGAIAIGNSSSAKDTGIAIGMGASCGRYSISLGYGASSQDDNLFIVGGFLVNNIITSYQLLDGTTGKIPNERLTLDSTPTSGSTNPITSGAVYAALGDIESALDAIIAQGSN